MNLDFKKWLQAFLLDPSFGDIEFLFFCWPNESVVLSSSYIITVVKDVYQFSQSIGKKYKIIIAIHNGSMIN